MKWRKFLKKQFVKLGKSRDKYPNTLSIKYIEFILTYFSTKKISEPEV